MAKVKLLGERYRDTMFGLEGIAMARQDHMDLGARVMVEVVDPSNPNSTFQYWFMEGRIERVKGQPKAVKTVKCGGRHNIKFGNEYRDKIHGITGVAVSRTEHLTGCERIHLEMAKGGKITATEIDESVLEAVKKPLKAKKVTKKARRGGPQPSAPSLH